MLQVAFQSVVVILKVNSFLAYKPVIKKFDERIIVIALRGRSTGLTEPFRQRPNFSIPIEIERHMSLIGKKESWYSTKRSVKAANGSNPSTLDALNSPDNELMHPGVLRITGGRTSSVSFGEQNPLPSQPMSNRNTGQQVEAFQGSSIQENLHSFPSSPMM